MQRQPYSAFEHTRSENFVAELVPAARAVATEKLVDITHHRKDERTRACAGVDPLSTIVAYAQEKLIYSADHTIIAVDAAHYATTPRLNRVNVFGLAYRPDAKLWLHHILADIVVGAAIHLYQTQHWHMVVFDGLRTVEGAFKLYNFATDDDLEAGLLALPGKSAHNKGLAVDSMFFDEKGCEIDMGGHFDHTAMNTNSRTYKGNKISAVAQKNRELREAAFLRAALTEGLLIAPLRSEFWDDRPPENRADLWRVLDSAARVMQQSFTLTEDRERWNYTDFQSRWHDLFKTEQSKLEDILGVAAPPDKEKPEFYHGNFHPIHDRDLIASGKYLTEL